MSLLNEYRRKSSLHLTRPIYANWKPMVSGKMLISWKIKMLQIQLMYSGEKKGPLTPHNTAHGLPYLWDFNVMESLFLLSPVHFLAIESGHSYQVENEFSTWSTILSMTAKCVRRSHKLLSIIIYSFAN